MSEAGKLALTAIWPPSAPLGQDYDAATRRWWLLTSVLSFFFFTAFFHNRVFFSHSCMLIGLAKDYNLHGLKIWITTDPSPYAGAAAAFALYHLGERLAWVRLAAAPLFVSMLPVMVWIWDIPLTHRIICSQLHDKRSIRLVGVELNTIHVFVPGAIAYTALFALSLKKYRSRKEPAPPIGE